MSPAGKTKPFRKGNHVTFITNLDDPKPEHRHNMLAHRPGVVTGHKSGKVIVRCTEKGTVFFDQEYLTPRTNLAHRTPCRCGRFDNLTDCIACLNN